MEYSSLITEISLGEVLTATINSFLVTFAVVGLYLFSLRAVSGLELHLSVKEALTVFYSDEATLILLIEVGAFLSIDSSLFSGS